MHTKPIRFFIPLFLLVIIFSVSLPTPVSAAGTASVNGNVRDALFTNVPISGATITCSSGCTGSPSTTTDGSGNYSLPISWGGLLGFSSITIRASAAGYSASESNFIARANQTYTRNFSLNPIDSTPPVIVSNISGTLGNASWYISNVTVSWNVTDSESAITSTSGCGTTTIAINTSGQTLTCSATSGGGTSSNSVTIKIDKTAPVVTIIPQSFPNVFLWYNSPITFDVDGTDGFSGVDTCSPATTYSGPDSGTASVSGSCTDKAGNVSTISTFTFKYDATAPNINFIAARPPDSNGWYTAPLSVSVSGSDSTSGILLCTPILAAQRTYSGPDNSSASINGTCRDRAGNVTNGSFSLQYDTTAPTSAVLSASGTIGNDEWYVSDVTISTAGTDNVSAVACTANQTVTTDTASITLSGSCTNGAGMTTTAVPLTIKRDATAPVVTATPSRSANSNGWYTSGLTVSFSGIDILSGGVTCEADKPYDGPDSSSVSIGGNCTDVAGNAGSNAYTLQYDATPPTGISVTANRDPDSGGYYNHAFTATWVGTDGTSGINSCSQINYSGPDTESGTLNGSCIDNAGNVSSSADFTFKFDASAPTNIIATADRIPDSGGYYNHPFTVTWSSTDNNATCTVTTYSGADTDTGSLSGSCTDPAGNSSENVDFAFKYDTIAPVASATISPAANTNGWNNSAVTVTFSGTDAGSGIDTCDVPVILNNNGFNQSATGSCTDNAGNISSPVAVSGINIDMVRPAIRLVSRTPDANFWGWNTTPVTAKWTCTDALSGVVNAAISDTVSSEGILQVAKGECFDKAGNSASDRVGNINILFPENFPIIVPVTGDEPPAANPSPATNNQTIQLTGPAEPTTNTSGIIPTTGGEEFAGEPGAPQKNGGNALYYYLTGGLMGIGLFLLLFLFLKKRRKEEL